jgi:hypothetical protein
MFSLIITIISIALVGALAITTLFFGGDSFLRGKSEAEAAQYINESQQISAAVRLFQAENSGEMPGDLQSDLVDNNYLKELPVSGELWEIGDNSLVKGVKDAETCEKVNEKSGWTNINHPDNDKPSEHSPASCDDTAALAGATYFCCTVSNP